MVPMNAFTLYLGAVAHNKFAVVVNSVVPFAHKNWYHTIKHHADNNQEEQDLEL